MNLYKTSKIKLLSIIFISINLCASTGYSIGLIPSAFQATFNKTTNNYQLSFNQTILGSGNAASGCYLLGDDVKCFTIDILSANNKDSIQCKSANFNSATGAVINPWSDFICGSFTINELLTKNPDRQTIMAYDSALFNSQDMKDTNKYYTRSQRIMVSNPSIRANQAPMTVYVYGTFRTSEKAFNDTVNILKYIINNLQNYNPQTNNFDQIDGQRFILINYSDIPAQMPGLQQFGMPEWINKTRGAPMLEIGTTIISEEALCFSNNSNPNPDWANPIYDLTNAVIGSLRLQGGQNDIILDKIFQNPQYLTPSCLAQDTHYYRSREPGVVYYYTPNLYRTYYRNHYNIYNYSDYRDRPSIIIFNYSSDRNLDRNLDHKNRIWNRGWNWIKSKSGIANRTRTDWSNRQPAPTVSGRSAETGAIKPFPSPTTSTTNSQTVKPAKPIIITPLPLAPVTKSCDPKDPACK